MLTPKQKDILGCIKRFGKDKAISAMDVGLYFEQPRKKAEKWAKPAIKELIKQKLVYKDENGYKPIIEQKTTMD